MGLLPILHGETIENIAQQALGIEFQLLREFRNYAGDPAETHYWICKDVMEGLRQRAAIASDRHTEKAQALMVIFGKMANRIEAKAETLPPRDLASFVQEMERGKLDLEQFIL